MSNNKELISIVAVLAGVGAFFLYNNKQQTTNRKLNEEELEATKIDNINHIAHSLDQDFDGQVA